jgi:hypothetical protein
VNRSKSVVRNHALTAVSMKSVVENHD